MRLQKVKKLGIRHNISDRNNIKPHHTTECYTHIQNLINVTFSHREFKILELGFQCNFEKPINMYITGLIIDTENAT
jgi:hypothetical protein